MDSSSHSAGHVGGMHAPSRWAMGRLPARDRGRHAPDVVPLRALRGARAGSRSAGSYGSGDLRPVRGMEGHGDPRQSTRVRRRAS